VQGACGAHHVERVARTCAARRGEHLESINKRIRGPEKLRLAANKLSSRIFVVLVFIYSVPRRGHRAAAICSSRREVLWLDPAPTMCQLQHAQMCSPACAFFDHKSLFNFLISYCGLTAMIKNKEDWNKCICCDDFFVFLTCSLMNTR